MTILPHSKF